MQVTSLIFLLVAVPIAFCMLTWVIATVYRLYFPEAPIETSDTGALRFAPQLKPINMPVAVGAREIKEHQRRRQSTSATQYSFANGFSNGVPTDWVDDVWRRRN